MIMIPGGWILFPDVSPVLNVDKSVDEIGESDHGFVNSLDSDIIVNSYMISKFIQSSLCSFC